MSNDMPEVSKQIPINFPIRISMSGYSIKDNHGRMLFKMEMNGDSWKNHKKIEQFLSDAEQIVNLVNANQQLIKEAEERQRERLIKEAKIRYELKNIDRKKDPGLFPQDLSLDEIIFFIGLNAGGE